MMMKMTKLETGWDLIEQAWSRLKIQTDPGVPALVFHLPAEQNATRALLHVKANPSSQ